MPGVVAVVTGEALAAHGLAWMPTLSGDTQAVLATDKVRFQGQEVAAVIAESPYIAYDALDLIDVEYEPLPGRSSIPQQAIADDAVLIRDEKEGQSDNRCYHWEAGDKEATDRAFAEADVVVALDTFYPRSHPAPLETCGCVADVNPATKHVTIYMTSQAPHAHRTLFAIVAGLPEQNIRIISPDIGGGFGNKVPIYPGYVVATAASLLIGRPVKWIESRTENLISTGFARDYYMKGELALTNDGQDARAAGEHAVRQRRVLRRRPAVQVPGRAVPHRHRLLRLPAAHIVTDGTYTNKAPGGVAYRCSFRVTEASYLIERLVQNAAYELDIDPAELRRRNFIQPDQFPYHSVTGFVYDSGDYPRAMQKALELIEYDKVRQEQEEARKEGKLIGIGLASFTEVVGAGHGAEYDIAGLRMFDSAELRVHPTGKAILKLGVQVAGPGPRDDVRPDRRQRARHPRRATSPCRRATPTTRRTGSGPTPPAARRWGERPPRSSPASSRRRPRRIAAHLLEADVDDVDGEPGGSS